MDNKKALLTPPSIFILNRKRGSHEKAYAIPWQLPGGYVKYIRADLVDMKPGVKLVTIRNGKIVPNDNVVLTRPTRANERKMG